MPTYEYRCKSCSHELEVQQSFTDDPLSTCPSCGAESLRKVFGNIAVTFKGSGFYKTDSRGGTSSTSSSSSDSGSASESTSDSKSKSESTSTKSESKTETAAAS